MTDFSYLLNDELNVLDVRFSFKSLELEFSNIILELIEVKDFKCNIYENIEESNRRLEQLDYKDIKGKCFIYYSEGLEIEDDNYHYFEFSFPKFNLKINCEKYNIISKNDTDFIKAKIKDVENIRSRLNKDDLDEDEEYKIMSFYLNCERSIERYMLCERNEETKQALKKVLEELLEYRNTLWSN